MATRQRTPNAMDLLLGAAPKPGAAAAGPTAPTSARSVEPADGHAPAVLLEETGELLPAEGAGEAVETPAAAAQNETPAAAETAEPAVEAVVPAASEPAAPKTRRSRRRPAAAPTEDASAVPVVEASAAPAMEPAVAAPAPASVVTAGRRRREPDEDLEPAYVPIKVTVSIPAVVVSELIRTVQTIRRMTGRRQPVNQGTVIAAALEMAFEEFRKKGATSQLVDRLRDEG